MVAKMDKLFKRYVVACTALKIASYESNIHAQNKERNIFNQVQIDVDFNDTDIFNISRLVLSFIFLRLSETIFCALKWRSVIL